MKKIYHLANCGTCQNIIKELSPIPKGTELQDIKFKQIISFICDLGLNEKTLSEKEYKKYILKEYTFLKRPVLLFNDQIFIGNAPKTVAAAKAFLQKK